MEPTLETKNELDDERKDGYECLCGSACTPTCAGPSRAEFRGTYLEHLDK